MPLSLSQATEWTDLTLRVQRLENRFDEHMQNSLGSFNDLKNLIIKLERKVDILSRGERVNITKTSCWFDKVELPVSRIIESRTTPSRARR